MVRKVYMNPFNSFSLSQLTVDFHSINICKWSLFMFWHSTTYKLACGSSGTRTQSDQYLMGFFIWTSKTHIRLCGTITPPDSSFVNHVFPRLCYAPPKIYSINHPYLGSSFCCILQAGIVAYNKSYEICAHFHRLLKHVFYKICAFVGIYGLYKRHVE